ncbi:MAG: glutaminase A [Limisphaerales bacterium]
MAARNPSPPSPLLESLTELHREVASVREGAVATYIPELAKADPDWFGICLATPTGSVYEVGDTSIPFTIQSISKPFVYGIALEDNGRASVLAKVGVEPTGDAFNSISLEPDSGRPRNPMINAGAIATTGLIAATTSSYRDQRVQEALGRFAGRDLGIDEAVFRSESETGHRNRAIGHMLRNFGILETDPIPVVESYFRQCSISVTCRDLAIMAATLANRGVNPLTGKPALRGEYVESVLSVMETCGMYDSAGRWVYEIGMPAKSGVSGGIVAVLPGQVGIGVFSPPLDPQGNSVRGIRVCRALSRYLDLHLLNRPPVGRMVIRRRLAGSEFGSNRIRTAEERARLREAGESLQLYQLQGHLTFSSCEVLLADLLGRLPEIRQVIIDFKRVLSADESTCYLLHQLVVRLRERGIFSLFTHTGHLRFLGRYLRRKLGDNPGPSFQTFADNDRALEWCEDRILLGDTPTPSPASAAPAENVAPVEFALLQGLSQADADRVRALFRDRPFKKNETLIEVGAAADELFLLEEGHVSVLLVGTDGSGGRLATFSPGMYFGEMALLDRAPRSARVVADTDGTCRVLTREDFDRLEAEHPGALLGVFRNLCIGFSGRLRKANTERAALD